MMLRCPGAAAVRLIQSFAASSRALARWATLRAHRVSVCWRWRIELCRILRTGLGLGADLSASVLPMLDEQPMTEQEITELWSAAGQREDWDEMARLLPLLRAARGVKEPTPQEIADEQAANVAHTERECYLHRTGQHEQALYEHERRQRAIPLYGNAAALHLQRQPGGPACRDVALRVRVRAVRPVSRRRGAGAPSRRKTATASSGGSSDSDGSSSDGPGPGEPADLETDIDVFAFTGEAVEQFAVRLAVVLALESGEVVLSADAAVRDLVAEALPIVLSLLNRRGQTAAAAPTIFSDAWSIFVGEVTA